MSDLMLPSAHPSGVDCVLCGNPAGPSHANTPCGKRSTAAVTEPSPEERFERQVKWVRKTLELVACTAPEGFEERVNDIARVLCVRESDTWLRGANEALAAGDAEVRKLRDGIRKIIEAHCGDDGSHEPEKDAICDDLQSLLEAR